MGRVSRWQRVRGWEADVTMQHGASSGETEDGLSEAVPSEAGGWTHWPAEPRPTRTAQPIGVPGPPAGQQDPLL